MPVPKAKAKSRPTAAKSKAKAKARAAPSPTSPSNKRDYVEVVKDEVDRVDQQKRPQPKKNSPKKDNEPESQHEARGNRGRPRSTSARPGAASSSSAAAPKSKPKESFELIKPAGKDVMTQVQSVFALGKSKKEYLVKQLELRGFQGQKLTEIKRMSKKEILDIIEKLIDEDKWV